MACSEVFGFGCQTIELDFVKNPRATGADVPRGDLIGDWQPTRAGMNRLELTVFGGVSIPMDQYSSGVAYGLECHG